MSWEALAWAKNQKIGNAALKFLLVMVAEKADSDNECWPSNARLADEVECSVRTIQRGLDELEQRGLIRREQQRRENGSQMSNKIIINPRSEGVTNCHPGGDKIEAASPFDTPPHDTSMSPLEPHKEPNPFGSSPDADASGENLGGATSEELDLRIEAPQPVSKSEARTAQELATAYYDQEPLSNFPAVMQIARKALRAGHEPDLIKAALLRMAEDGRTVTTNALRTELNGPPRRRYDELTPKDRQIKDQVDKYGLDLMKMFPQAAATLAADRLAGMTPALPGADPWS